MPKIKEIDRDLPAYLEFNILKDLRKLREQEPDHYLVKAITAACREELEDKTITGVLCSYCGLYLEPHTESEHLDDKHPVHDCDTGHRRNPQLKLL